MQLSISSLLCALLVLGSSPALAEFLPVDQEVDDKPTAILPSSLVCPLNCQNGAACVKVQAEKTAFGVDFEDEWQCACPSGYGGRFCEAKRRGLAVNCSATFQCHHGGKCGDNHNYTGTGEFVCDCSNAKNASGTKFVGQTCEDPVTEDNYCPGKKNLDLFCMNGGTCRVATKNYEERPCTCDDEYTGRHCEYHVQEVQDECYLSCGNGTCHHGFSPYGDSEANNVLATISGYENSTQNFMYCACNSGYAGRKCEFSYINCGQRRGYCFHGAVCAPDGSEDLCDCSTTVNATKTTAGDHCQYLATDKCNTPKIIHNATYHNFTESYRMNVSDGEYPFCVNDGVCYKLNNTEIYYCSCVPGYRGSRCEVHIATAAPSSTPSPSEAVTESAYPTILASYTEDPVSMVTFAPVAKPTAAPHNAATAAPHHAATAAPHHPTNAAPTPQSPGVGRSKPTWAPTRAPTETMSVASSEAEAEADAGIALGISFAVLVTLLALVVVVAYFNNRSEFVNSMVYQNNAEDNIPPSHTVNISLPAEEELTTGMRRTSTATMDVAEGIGEPYAKEII